MSARLFCRHGPLRGLDFEIGDEVLIGRGSSKDISIDSDLVSNEHARILHDEERGCYVLTDLGSANGTELDGEPVTQEEVLDRLHVLSFGRSGDFIFIDDGRDTPVPTTSSPAAVEEKRTDPVESSQADETQFEDPLPVIPPRLPGSHDDKLTGDRTEADGEAVRVPSELGRSSAETVPGVRTTLSDDVVGVPTALAGDPVSPAPPEEGWILEVAGGNSGALRINLPTGEATIGRGSDCPIRLDEDGLSRHHARVTTSGDSVRIRDLGSTNGTFVAGKRLEADEDVTIEMGAQLRFCETLATLKRGRVE